MSATPKILGIKGILLDLDNTLYPYSICNEAGNASLVRFVAERIRQDPEDVARAFVAGRDDVHQTIPGTGSSHSRLLYINRCLELLTGKADPVLALEAADVFWDAYFAKMRLRPGVMDFLEATKRVGIKIAIVSNLIAAVQFKKLVRLSIAPLIDIVVTSEEAGADKPDSRIFELALRRLGMSAHEVVMIGDHYEKDILAAEKLGIRAIHFVHDAVSGTPTHIRSAKTFADISAFVVA